MHNSGEAFLGSIRRMSAVPFLACPDTPRPRTAWTTSRRCALLGALVLSASDCWYSVEQYCAECQRVAHTQVHIPAVTPGTHTEVVLIHGAFGFGPEWTPVVESLRQTPGVDFFAWSWPGPVPFANPPRDAQLLAAELQVLIDQLPPSVEEIVVLAHSAGAGLANYAARQLQRTLRRRILVALLDPVLWPMLSLWPALRQPALYPPAPAGVAMTVYIAREPRALDSDRQPGDAATTADLPHVYVGNIGHGSVVARIALPLLAAHRRPPGPQP